MTAVLSEAAGSCRGLRVENRNLTEKVAGRARLVPLIYPAPEYLVQAVWATVN